VVAVVRAIGFLHLSQEGVHLGDRQQAARADGALAGHAGEELVALHRRQLRRPMLPQFVQQRTRQIRWVGGEQQCGDAAHRELSWADRREVEAELLQRRRVFLGGSDVDLVGAEDGRNEQRL